jgi:hypothetical protein
MIYYFDGKPMNYAELQERIDDLQTEGKTYFAVGTGTGSENTSLDVSQDDDYFTDSEKAKAIFQKKIASSHVGDRYVVMEVYSPENDYRAEIMEIWYSEGGKK